MQFRATVELGGKTATGFEVPGRVVDELGAGKRPAVRVTVNGHRYRSTVAVMGGRFLLPLNAQNRAAAGVAAGDEATADLAAALDAEPAARTRFDGLSHSMQRRWVFPVEDAKTDATRQRRIATMVQTLAGEAADSAARDGRPSV